MIRNPRMAAGTEIPQPLAGVEGPPPERPLLPSAGLYRGPGYPAHSSGKKILRGT